MICRDELRLEQIGYVCHDFRSSSSEQIRLPSRYKHQHFLFPSKNLCFVQIGAKKLTFQNKKDKLNSFQNINISCFRAKSSKNLVSFKLEHEKLGFVQNPARNTRYAASGQNWICILLTNRTGPHVQRTGRTSREPAAIGSLGPHQRSTGHTGENRSENR